MMILINTQNVISSMVTQIIIELIINIFSFDSDAMNNYPNKLSEGLYGDERKNQKNII
jgi:hypothetical protein